MSYGNGVQTVERNANIGNEWLLLKKNSYLKVNPLKEKNYLYDV